MTAHKPGPTGEFPEGKLNNEDGGGLNIGVGHDYKGNVIVDFGASVSWIAFLPSDARALAAILNQHADQAQARLGPQQ